MKQLIISFKSRNDLYGFSKILKSHNIFVSIINTPKHIGSSCTLSIRSELRFLQSIQQLLYQHQPRSFLGLFSVSTSVNGEQIIRLL